MSTTAEQRQNWRQELEAFGAHYQYEVGYLSELLAHCPEGFAAFRGLQALGSYQRVLSPEVLAVARVASMRAEDCGACGQLNLQMAAEAGVGREILATLVAAPESLPSPLAEVHAHAQAVAGGELPEPARVAFLRQELGAEGLCELALAVVAARSYPGLKRALGVPTQCQPLSLP